MKYYYVPITLRYFSYGLNWRFDFDNKKLMKANNRQQAAKKASNLFKIEKEKNFGFGESVISIMLVNQKKQKELKKQYPKEAIFLGLDEIVMFVSGDRDKNQWVKSPVKISISRP